MSSSTAPLFLCEALEEEYEKLHGNNLPSPRTKIEGDSPEQKEKINEARVANLYQQIHQLPQPRSALCISGGGIRSATFALGVLQGLARHGVLDQFDYLSTVSGGGYVGSWLTAWIHHRQQNLAEVSRELGGRPASPLEPEPPQISHLRAYSNYLTPKLGLLSADTGALVATYLRNLLLNWLVIIPLLAGALALPRLCVAVVCWKPSEGWEWLVTGALWGGFWLGVLAVAYITSHIPSASASASLKDKKGFWRWLAGQSGFIWFCLSPLLLAAVFLTTYWAWYRHLGYDAHGLWSFIWFGVLLHFLGWLSGTGLSLLRDAGGWLGQFKKAWSRIVLAGVIVLITGALGGMGAWAVATKVFCSPVVTPLVSTLERNAVTEWYVCLAAPVFLMLFLIAATFFVGFASRLTDDDDREWYARFGAWLLIMLVLWSAGSIVVIFGPAWFLMLSGGYQTILASLGGGSGVLTALGGNSDKTAAKNSQAEKPSLAGLIMDNALSLCALVFLLFLVVGLSLGLSALIKWMTQCPYLALNLDLTVAMWRGDDFRHLNIVHFTPVWLAAGLVGSLALIGILMAWAININKFSMHAMYRNRLIRAYLGASNTERNPNPFTGFDPKDNIQMHELWPNPNYKEREKAGDQPRQKLLHVVNTTLNLVHGSDLAWQQRKAESFTVTPLHAGNYRLGYRRAEDREKVRYGGDDGISLGTAVTISGAAASPNMGYHSSPLVALLMTLLNVRLGCWLGNSGEAGENTFYLSQPRLMVRPLIAEAFGLTNDQNPYVYLSDGGHFENLGLYEMVLRRCRIIVVSDASCDPDYKFEDLGNAVDKIRVDLGVPIDFKELPIHPSQSKKSSGNKQKGKYCAIGTIRYSCVDGKGTDGLLIYLKPVLYGAEPRDVLAYSKSSVEFPHESTGDQWFSESQFESYRALGSHAIERICGAEQWQAESLDDFVKQVDQYLSQS